MQKSSPSRPSSTWPAITLNEELIFHNPETSWSEHEAAITQFDHNTRELEVETLNSNQKTAPKLVATACYR